MNNAGELREIKANIRGFVRSLERLKGLLGKETEVYASIRMNPTVANAFHKAQICTEQNIDAFLELDMALEDLLGKGAE